MIPRTLFCLMLLVTGAGADEFDITADPTPIAPLIIGPGIESFPNVGGGEDFQLPNGDVIISEPNVEGGKDFRFPDGRSVTCVPNIAGGQDCW